MARLVSTTVDTLITRARQNGGVAITNDTATKILTLCQQIVNISLKQLVTKTNFTVTANQQLYSLDTILPLAADVLNITDTSGRHLLQMRSLHDLAAYDSDWYYATGTRLEAWHQVSRDYLIIYPSLTANAPISIEYVRSTTIYDNYSALTGINMELPDEQVELALKLAECVLLLRSRDTILIEQNLEALNMLLKVHSNGLF